MAKRGQRGFTLLETLVAFSILSVSLSIFYNTFSISLDRQAGIDDEIGALTLAENNLVQVGESIPLTAGLLEGQEGNYAWTLAILPRPDPDSSLWLYQVTSEVSWPGSGGRQEISLETLKLGPEDAANE